MGTLRGKYHNPQEIRPTLTYNKALIKGLQKFTNHHIRFFFVMKFSGLQFLQSNQISDISLRCVSLLYVTVRGVKVKRGISPKECKVMMVIRILLGSDHPRTMGYVVNKHGDHFRPRRIGLWDPFQGGDPNHLHPSWYDPPSGDEGLQKVRRFPTIFLGSEPSKVVNGVMLCKTPFSNGDLENQWVFAGFFC